MSVDCRFDVGNERFQFRAGAVIIEDGCVLLAKCDAAEYYYTVGGAVLLGETAEEAVKREIFEETGLEYEVDRLVFVHENFFVDEAVLKGVNFHEVSFYYLMKPLGKSDITKESYCSGGREYMHWIPLGELGGLQIFPEFFREGLENLKDGVRHFVTNDIPTR